MRFHRTFVIRIIRVVCSHRGVMARLVVRAFLAHVPTPTAAGPWRSLVGATLTARVPQTTHVQRDVSKKLSITVTRSRPVTIRRGDKC